MSRLTNRAIRLLVLIGFIVLFGSLILAFAKKHL